MNAYEPVNHIIVFTVQTVKIAEMRIFSKIVQTVSNVLVHAISVMHAMCLIILNSQNQNIKPSSLMHSRRHKMQVSCEKTFFIFVNNSPKNISSVITTKIHSEIIIISTRTICGVLMEKRITTFAIVSDQYMLRILQI